jgi:hypothetical protein
LVKKTEGILGIKGTGKKKGGTGEQMGTLGEPWEIWENFLFTMDLICKTLL